MEYAVEGARARPYHRFESPPPPAPLSPPPESNPCTHTLHVRGMLCMPRCGVAVERAARQVKGVSSADLSFEEGLLTVHGTHDIAEVIVSVCALGFQVEMDEFEQEGINLVELRVQGMCCNTDANNVARVLVLVPGVRAARVTLEDERAVVVGSATPDTLIAIVNGLGYKTSIEERPFQVELQYEYEPSTPSSPGGTDKRSDKYRANTVRNMLCSVRGVACAALYTGTQTAVVRGTAPIPSLIKAIEDCGFKAHVKEFKMEEPDRHSSSSATTHTPNIGHMGDTTSIFEITGMTCGACVSAIENALTADPGVVSARVALLTEKAEVLYDSTLTNRHAVAELIESVGYNARHIYTRTNDGAKTSRARFLVWESRVPGGESSNDAFGFDEHSHVSPHSSPRPLGQTNSMSLSQTARSDTVTAIELFNKVKEALMTSPGIVKVDPVEMSGVKHLIEVQYESEVTGVRNICHVINKRCKYRVQLGSGSGTTHDQMMLRHKSQLQQYVTALLTSIMLSAPIMLLQMTFSNEPLCNIYALPGLSLKDLLVFVLASGLQWGPAMHFTQEAYKGLRARPCILGMSFLVTLGTMCAYLFATFTLFISIATKGSSKPDPELFMTSSMIITFVLAGKVMETFAKSRTSSALQALLKVRAKSAMLLNVIAKASSPSRIHVDETAYQVKGEREIPADYLQRGDIIKVLRGMVIPADGVVSFGRADVNESMITGESMPRVKKVGDRVIGGTLAVEGSMHVRVTSVAEDTVLSQIVKLVEDAQTAKPQLQLLADVVAGRFAIFASSVSLFVFVTWFMILTLLPNAVHITPRGPPLATALTLAISTLVISCPCAMGLATPTAVMVGIGVGAKLGILFRGARALELIPRVTAIIFDKTGTLTSGTPGVSSFTSVRQDMTSEKVLWFAACAETCSEHVLGRSIVRHARAHIEEPLQQPASFKAITGRGIRCKVANSNVSVGSREFLACEGVDTRNAVLVEVCEKAEEAGRMLVYVAVDGELAGVIEVFDFPRPQAAACVQALGAAGLQVWMVTGDNRRTAYACARAVGIIPSQVVAEALPSNKIQHVKNLQHAGHIVAFVGDGINDSPALAQADVGIALGEGTDVAAESSDLVLMTSELMSVLTAMELCASMVWTIRLNLFWAFLYNVIAMPLAAGLLVPLTHSVVPPYVSSMAMALSSTSVVLSSLSLMLFRPKQQRPRPSAISVSHDHCLSSLSTPTPTTHSIMRKSEKTPLLVSSDNGHRRDLHVTFDPSPPAVRVLSFEEIRNSPSATSLEAGFGLGFDEDEGASLLGARLGLGLGLDTEPKTNTQTHTHTHKAESAYGSVQYDNEHAV